MTKRIAIAAAILGVLSGCSGDRITITVHDPCNPSKEVEAVYLSSTPGEVLYRLEDGRLGRVSEAQIEAVSEPFGWSCRQTP